MRLGVPLPSPSFAVAGGAVDVEHLLPALQQLVGDRQRIHLHKVGGARDEAGGDRRVLPGIHELVADAGSAGCGQSSPPPAGANSCRCRRRHWPSGAAAWAAAPCPGRCRAAACGSGCPGSRGRPRWPARREQRWQGSSALFLHQFDVPAAGVFQQLAGCGLRVLRIVALDHNEELVMRHLRRSAGSSAADDAGAAAGSGTASPAPRQTPPAESSARSTARRDRTG